MSGHWRREAQKVIYPALREGMAMGLKGRALRRHIGKQYPFGVRAHFPYRVWLDELEIALNERTPGPANPQTFLDLFNPGPELAT